MLGDNKIKLFRFIDFTLALTLLICTFPLIILLLCIGFFESGKPIFLQKRLGINKNCFVIFKLRTMQKNTVSLATHLTNPNAVTLFGRFLRRSKLDELPQLLNVLKGDMSLVGPRPGLPNQTELTEAREKLGVFLVKPGITGLAQVNSIDMSTPKTLAETDKLMISTMSISNYFKYIVLTVCGKGKGDRIIKKF